ncbi:MAG: bifunctional metallophosphatase/5'-nucleotidase, partial [Clostridiales bacterium]|nr:bifunctional metallophosphatase/5'-nucleotidase [Clostridiales bacterium]
MKKTSRILAVLLTICMILSMIPAVFAEKADTVIYFTNDVHGEYGNYAYAAEIMKDGDLIVDAGDNIQGSVAASLTKGQCMVDLMKAVGYDLAIPGNHEFDYGFVRFLEIVKGENTPYICANLWDKVGDKALLDGYKILEAGGKKIAFIGITTPETLVKSTPTFFQNEKGEWIYDFCNDEKGEKLYKVVQDNVDAAKKAGAEYVIAIGHLGIDEQSEPWTSTSVIKNTTGIDALIDGHSHSEFAKTEKNKDGKDVVVAQTGTKLAKVGKMTIDAEGKIKAELIDVVAGEEAAFDADVAKAVADVKAEIDKISETVVAKTEVKLTTLDPDTDKRAVRNAETNLGDLCADAYRSLLGTDIAFVNGGGVRADIAEGDVTYGQIIAVHPFGNMACSIKVTGKQILEALELGASAHPGESGGFLQVSGLEYTINDGIESPVIIDESKMFVGLKEGAAHRVIDVKIGGKPLDEKATYTLGGHNYMLKQCGDGYAMFKGCEVIADEIAVDNEVLIRYIRDTLKGLVAKDSIYANLRGEGRIKVINEPFTDVKADAWYHDYVVDMANRGIIKGMTQTTFEPEGKLTRGQVAVLLYRMAGEPEVKDLETVLEGFKDVKTGKYYTEAVAWAKSEGLVKGMTEDTFAPEANVTRAQLVTILYRHAGEPKVEKAASFDDVKAGAWYANAIAWAKELGVVNGMTEKTFEPDGLC